MKHLFSILTLSLSLSSFAMESRTLILQHEDSENKITQVKLDITEKMVELRLERMFQCYYRKNMKFAYGILAGDFIIIKNGETNDNGRQDAILSMKGLEDVFAFNIDREKNEEFTIVSPSNYSDSAYQAIEDIPTVKLSTKTKTYSTNNFMCFSVNPMTGEQLDPLE
jgi:hypothetical protein